MNRVLAAVTATLAALACGWRADAADMVVKQAPPLVPALAGNGIVAANNQVSIDFIGRDFNYQEFPDPARSGPGPSVLDSEKGWVPGLRISGSVMTDVLGINHVYVSGQFSWLNGTTDYWSEPLSDRSGATVNDFDFRLGKGFDIGQSAMLTPYFGAGTDWWHRTLPGAGGYNEYYSHAYAGGGLLFQYSPASRLVLSVNGLAGSTFDSGLTVSPKPGGAPVTGFAVPLGNSIIWMVGSSADYAITERVHVNVGIDYVNYKYGESPIVSAGPAIGLVYEPTSRTSDVTVSAGAGYAF